MLLQEDREAQDAEYLGRDAHEEHLGDMARDLSVKPADEWCVSNESYHSDATAISHSAKEIAREWMPTYHARFVARTMPAPRPTEAMTLGTAFHCRLLEPMEFDNRFVVAPECDKRTKVGKELWADFEAENAGKTVIKLETLMQVCRMVDAAHANSDVAYFLSIPQKREVAYRWTDNLSGLLCKCKPDIWVRDASLIADIKTSSDPCNWIRQAANFGYARQSAHYSDGMTYSQHLSDYAKVVHIVVGTTEPHPVIVYMLGPQSLDVGRCENRQTLAEIAECHRTGIWVDKRQGGIQHCELPYWALKGGN